MDKKLEAIMQDIINNDEGDALASSDDLAAALKEKGCTEEEIASVLEGFAGFPLDDDDLIAITGGASVHMSAGRDPTLRT